MIDLATKVPTLRFSGHDSDWGLKKLGEISIKVGSGSTPRGGQEVYQNHGVLFIRSQNVNHDRLSLDDTVFIPEAVHKLMKGSAVYPLDVLLNITGASLGRTCIVPESFPEGNVNQHVCIIRLSEDYSPKFLQLFLTSSRGQKLMIEGQTGSGREGLNFQSIRNFKVALPTLPEQQKIAAFLTAVDDKIQQLNQKKALLEQYKKGVMQQIFNQKIRFKDDDGKDYPDWNSTQLGHVSIVVMGQSPDSKSYNQTFEGLMLIQGNADIKDRKSNPRNWTSLPTKTCSPGDLILTVRAPVGAVAKSIHHACLGRGVCSIKNTSKSDSEYLYQFLLSYEAKWARIEQGSTFTAVSGADIRSISIEIPCLKEQTKIANFLSAIDNKINHVNQQLELTKQFKKGLLQQMFV